MPEKVIADPDEIKKFANSLQTFNRRMLEEMQRLNGEFAHLSETWRDPQHQRFAQEFEQTMTVLRRFSRSSEQHVPVLRKWADKLANVYR